jgi:hypothetical protein
MIAQDQSEDSASPIITSFTTQSALMKIVTKSKVSGVTATGVISSPLGSDGVA